MQCAPHVKTWLEKVHETEIRLWSGSKFATSEMESGSKFAYGKVAHNRSAGSDLDRSD